MMSVSSSWCEREEGVQRPSTAPSSPPVAPILGLVSFLVCLTMSTLSSHPRTSFRVVLERFPNHHWPHLSLLYFPSETKFSSFRKIEPRDFRGGAVVKNPPPIQGTQVWSLIWEDPTRHRATKPMHPDCFGPASAGSRGYPWDEWRQWEKTRETSLDRAKSARQREIDRDRERDQRERERERPDEGFIRVWQGLAIIFLPWLLYPKLVHL